MKRHRPARRLAVVLVTLLALVVVPSAFGAPVYLGYGSHTGVMTPSAGTIADAVAADDGVFVQMAPASTITLALPAGVYAVPDGTGAADLTVHVVDALFPASADIQVYVKSNLNAWVSMGVFADTADIGLNLEGVGIVHEVLLDQGAYPIDPLYPTLGFDLDAVSATTTVTLTEGCGAPASYLPGWRYGDWQSFVSAVTLGVVTATPLVDGVAYRFEARGLYSAGPAGANGTEILADARYSKRVVGQADAADVVFGYGPDPTLLDLLLDSGAANWQGGVFNADHAYTADRVGSGSPASFAFQVYDVYAANNIGGLCVSLYVDNLGPVTSNVAVAPDLVPAGSDVTVTADVSDATRNGSDIASAEYRVDGEPWVLLTATAAPFDEPTEAVSGPLADVPAGIHEICVRGVDKAGNVGDAACAELRVYDRSAKVSGVVAGNKLTWKDTGEPDWAFEGLIYAAGTTTVWGEIHVNYKLLGETCTFTADEETTFTVYGGPLRVDVSELLNSCDGERYTVQLLHRGGFGTPRGGVFISKEPGDYTQSTLYELFGAAGALAYYVPLDRGNVIVWVAA